MKSFIVAAALAATGALGFASKADAQVYVSTYTPGGGFVVSTGYPWGYGTYNYPSYSWSYTNPSYYWYSNPYYGGYSSRYDTGYWPGGYFGGYPYYGGRYGGYRYGSWGRRWRE